MQIKSFDTGYPLIIPNRNMQTGVRHIDHGSFSIYDWAMPQPMNEGVTYIMFPLIGGDIARPQRENMSKVSCKVISVWLLQMLWRQNGATALATIMLPYSSVLVIFRPVVDQALWRCQTIGRQKAEHIISHNVSILSLIKILDSVFAHRMALFNVVDKF